MLAGAIVLTSQGIPFLHAGVEFCRTKNGNGNSYNAPDQINQLDWVRKSVYKEVYDYFRQLIQLRKNIPLFRLPTSEMIREQLNFCMKYQIGVISYCLKAKEEMGKWNFLIVVFNANRETVSIPLPEGDLTLIAKGSEISEDGLGTINDTTLQVEPVTMMILGR